MSDEPLSICPECGAHVRRVLYPAGIVFKGSGFYKTDHSNGSRAAKTNGTSETKTPDATPTETKAATESKTSESKTGENKTQVDMAEAAGVTEVTIRNRSRDLKDNYQFEEKNFGSRR